HGAARLGAVRARRSGERNACEGSVSLGGPSFHQFDGWCIRHREVKLVYESAVPPCPGPGHRCLFGRAAIETTATKIRGPSWSPLNRSFEVTVMVCAKRGGVSGNGAEDHPRLPGAGGDRPLGRGRPAGPEGISDHALLAMAYE